MNALDTALQTRLQGTAILALLAGTTSAYPNPVYHLQAKNGAPMPYVVYSIQGGGDLNSEPHRIKDLVVFVRAYSAMSAGNAGSIDAQIDSALHLIPLTVSGWSNLWLSRERDLETVEDLPNNTQIFMSGGFYRTMLEKT